MHRVMHRVMRLLNIEPGGYSPEARTIIESLGESINREIDRAELLALLPEIDVLIVRLRHQIDREILEAGTRLRAIVSATTGLDHVDTAFAARRGIAVISLQGEREFLRTVPATAEHTWALLLALVRRIPWAAAAVNAGVWNRDAFKGRELRGRRLGLVGLGRVGQDVARYGAAFGMTVAAFDPHLAEWPDGVRRATGMDELFRMSDIVSLHVPLTAATEGLVGAGELAWLPPDALLVNTSRGELVDEDALVHALVGRTLAGAALDVVRHERDATQRRASALMDYLATHDNLLITPHIAGATHESMPRAELFVARKLAAFLSGDIDVPPVLARTGPAA